MKAILTAKRYEDTGFSVDVEFREDDDSIITTKTLSFSGAIEDISMQTVKNRAQEEAARLARIQLVNQDPDATVGTDLLL